MKRIVVAITGASGSVYGVSLVEALLRHGAEVHLLLSGAGSRVLAYELRTPVRIEKPDFATLLDAPLDGLTYHRPDDLFASIASGSYLCDAMVVAPCSMGTLARIATGAANSLIERAADVMLKERRKLVLMTREAPLNAIHLKNMLAVTEAGGVILPASPGWYHRPESLQDLVDFMTARVFDQLGIETEIAPRWGSKPAKDES
jgi:4-hydroxy-3-polyprenylbenzoate decarboxylase